MNHFSDYETGQIISICIILFTWLMTYLKFKKVWSNKLTIILLLTGSVGLFILFPELFARLRS